MADSVISSRARLLVEVVLGVGRAVSIETLREINVSSSTQHVADNDRSEAATCADASATTADISASDTVAVGESGRVSMSE